MFDMEKQIESWRATVSGALGKRGDAIDELEGHLRDDLEKLAREGLAPEQAWEEAMKRLGTPEQLASEFDKARFPKWLAAWCAVGGLVVVGALAGWLALRLPHRRGDLLLAVHVFAVTTGYSAVFAVGFLSLWATIWQALRGWDASRDAALRATGARLALLAAIATALGVVLGSWWAHDHLGRWWAWDARELGGVVVMGWSVVLLRGFRGHVTTQLLLLLGVTGNLVVGLAWFGPVLVDTSHGYGFSMIGMLLGGFMVSQIIVLYVAISWCRLNLATE
ncbi:MAG TPA: cytochrome c biogenesis protein CcsA [Tepidisphaeraceae bacterium]|jgi:hypothetical protein|nr:cytochrome c biogenesis protein CcsA [Tepidisphaeraceae bacterium]